MGWIKEREEGGEVGEGEAKRREGDGDTLKWEGSLRRDDVVQARGESEAWSSFLPNRVHLKSLKGGGGEREIEGRRGKSSNEGERRRGRSCRAEEGQELRRVSLGR